MQVAHSIFQAIPSFHAAAESPAATSRRETRRDERELSRIWPDCPLAIDAYDIADLHDPRSIEVIKCLLELCMERNQKELVILNLEHLVQENEGLSPVDQLYVVKRALFDACRQLGIPMPRLLLSRTAGNLDLRVFLRKPGPVIGNVVPLHPAPGRRPAAWRAAKP